MQDAEQAPGYPLLATITSDNGGNERVVGIGASRHHLAPFRLRLSPQQQQLAGDTGVARTEVERASRLATDLVERADIHRTFGSLEQQTGRPISDVIGQAGNRSDLGDELSRACCMVSDLIDRHPRDPAHHHRCTAMALRSYQLGECLISDLTNHVATEPPGRPVDVEQTVLVESVEIVATETLTHLGSELLQRLDGPGCPEHGSVVDDRTLRHRELVEASRDEGVQRPGERRAGGIRLGESGEFDEEQRVAAAALEETVDQCIAGRLTDHRSHEARGVVMGQRIQRHPHGDRMVAGRRPVEVGVVSLRRDDQHRAIDQRSRHPVQQLDDQHIGPLQVVDPQHDRAGPGATAEPFDDQREQDLARLRRRDMIELRRVTEQVQHRLDETPEHGIVSLESVQLDTLGAAHLAQQVRRRTIVEVESPEQRRGDRGPHIGLAVGGAHAGEDRDISAGKRVERLGNQAGLAGAGLAGDGDHRTSTIGDHRHDRCHQLSLRRTSHERNVVKTCADHRDETLPAGDTPHPFGPFAPTHLERIDGLAQDLLGGERGSGVADEDATRLGQGLQTRGNVDHVTHRRVLGGARHVPDDHLAGVHPDT